MNINFGNKVLNFGFYFRQSPNLEKLTEELSYFFKENKIEDLQIKKFRIEEKIVNQYLIVPIEPYLDEILSGGDYNKKLKEIGDKYGIKDLSFISWCYHK